MICQNTAENPILKGLPRDIIGAFQYNGILGFTVKCVNNCVLTDIHQAAGKVTSIRGPQGGVCQPFAGAVAGNEILQRR